MARVYQGMSQFPIIINFPITHDPDSAIFIRHRLLAGGQIDNRQTPVSQAYRALHIKTLIIWSPVSEGPGHGAQVSRIDGLLQIKIDYSGDTAHFSATSHPGPNFLGCSRDSGRNLFGAKNLPDYIDRLILGFKIRADHQFCNQAHQDGVEP